MVLPGAAAQLSRSQRADRTCSSAPRSAGTDAAGTRSMALGSVISSASTLAGSSAPFLCPCSATPPLPVAVTAQRCPPAAPDNQNAAVDERVGHLLERL